jgi:hypothetical protein
MIGILVGLALFIAGLWGVIKGQLGPLEGRGKAGLVTLAGIVLFFIGVGAVAQDASKSSKATTPPTSTAEVNTDQKAPSTPQQSSPSPRPTTAQPTTAQPTTAAKKEPAIPGLMPADISLNLDKAPYNLKFGDFKKGVTRYQKCGSRDLSGETMEVCIDSTNVNDVVFINATVLGTGVTSANLLLPFVATVPFDGNEPQKAKAWVAENLPKLKEGQTVETSFGGVKFVLFGNGKTNANLQILPGK